MTYANGITSSGTILGDLVSTMPPMLYGLSIIGTEIHFPLPRASMSLLDVDPAYTTHVCLLTLFGFFFFLCLLSDSFAL